MILRKRAVWSELFIPPDLILRSPEDFSILIEHSRNCLNPDSKMNLMHNMLKSCTCTESACPCPILIKNNQLLLVLAHAISIVSVHYLCLLHSTTVLIVMYFFIHWQSVLNRNCSLSISDPNVVVNSSIHGNNTKWCDWKPFGN